MTDTTDSWPLDEVGLNYDRTTVGFPELYVAFEIGLESLEGYEPANENTPEISEHELGIWLRHASSRVIHLGGQPTCGLSTPETIRVGSPLAKEGIHKPGSCVEDGDGCAIYDAFGPGSEINGQVKGHGTYTTPELNTWLDSTTSTVHGSSTSGKEPSSQTITVLWRLTIEENLAMLGLVAEGVNHLDSHASEYQVRLGDSSNIHATVRRATLHNPLYSPLERLRALETQSSTSNMHRKDDEWKRILRPASVEALQKKLSGPDGLNPAISSGNLEQDDSVDDTGDKDYHHAGGRKGDWAMSFWG